MRVYLCLQAKERERNGNVMRDHQEIYDKDLADDKYVSSHIEESTEPPAVQAHIQRVLTDWQNDPNHNKLP